MHAVSIPQSEIESNPCSALCLPALAALAPWLPWLPPATQRPVWIRNIIDGTSTTGDSAVAPTHGLRYQYRCAIAISPTTSVPQARLRIERCVRVRYRYRQTWFACNGEVLAILLTQHIAASIAIAWRYQYRVCRTARRKPRRSSSRLRRKRRSRAQRSASTCATRCSPLTQSAVLLSDHRTGYCAVAVAFFVPPLHHFVS